METVCEDKIRVNQGLNIRRIRTAKQMKQDTFAQKLGVTQQMVSLYEGQEVVDDQILEKCATALEVPIEVLKNLPAEEGGTVVIFKDFQKTEDFQKTTDTSSQTSNQVRNEVTNPLRDYVVNNYSNPEVLVALNDAISTLKSENKELRKEINALRAELKDKE